MIVPNEFDVLAWVLAAFLFFRGMEYGVRINTSGTWFWHKASILPAIIKAAITALPLIITGWARDYQTSPIWDAVCLVAIALFFAPIAFPQLPILREGASLGVKIFQWMIQRVDIVVRKGFALILLAGMFSLFPSCSASDVLRVTSYFPDHAALVESNFSMGVLIVATGSVVLKGKISPNPLIALILTGVAWLLGCLAAWLLGCLADIF